MEENNTNREERILSSLAGLQKAQAPDFFYTRLIGRMQNEMEPVQKPVFLLRPAFITAVLLVVFIVNIVSLTQLNKQETKVSADKPATIESFAKAYNMETGSVYE